MAIVEVNACKCDSCGHVWLPRNINGNYMTPIRCARCRSHYWNRKTEKLLLEQQHQRQLQELEQRHKPKQQKKG